MSSIRIALANLRYPSSAEDSVRGAVQAIDHAAKRGARVLCFPECYVPGYRARGPRPDREFLARASADIRRATERAAITVVLGTERFIAETPVLTAMVIAPDGTIAGFQDKVQLDPSEEDRYGAGEGRRVFVADEMTFGVVICHEGFRYPETVRWAARHGAQLVFHPHYSEPEPGSYRPATFADPANSFHEKSALCRAAENSCWFATVNCATPGSPTTSAVVRPDGTLLVHQPYGEEGLLVADLDLELATGYLASRCRS